MVKTVKSKNSKLQIRNFNLLQNGKNVQICQMIIAVESDINNWNKLKQIGKIGNTILKTLKIMINS